MEFARLDLRTNKAGWVRPIQQRIIKTLIKDVEQYDVESCDGCPAKDHWS